MCDSVVYVHHVLIVCVRVSTKCRKCIASLLISPAFPYTCFHCFSFFCHLCLGEEGVHTEELDSELGRKLALGKPVSLYTHSVCESVNARVWMLYCYVCHNKKNCLHQFTDVVFPSLHLKE